MDVNPTNRDPVELGPGCKFKLNVAPSLRTHRRLLSPGVVFVVGLVAAVTAFIATETGTFAQADVPDAPTDLAVYTIETQKLEVRWSTSDASATDSFKIQWKSGSEEFDSSRQMTSDPSASKVAVQSTSTLERYKETITGLTDGTGYTVRVLATNSQGDSEPSEEATGTPQSRPSQAKAFIEKEVIEQFEDSHPWLRETWDYLTARNVEVAFFVSSGIYGGEGGFVGVDCPEYAVESNLRKCSVTEVQIGRYDPRIIYVAIHELAHVYTLQNGLADTPGAVGVAFVYFFELLPPSYRLLPNYRLVANGCKPSELYAEALSLLTMGEEFEETLSYWNLCDLVTDAVGDEALAVAGSAASGEIPSWFTDTYNDADGDTDLTSFWLDVKEIRDIERKTSIVYQLRDAFGGYCDNRKATESAFAGGVTRNPWKDGGCVPDAPSRVSGTAVGGGKLAVSWQEPTYDGGSPIEGYKVQWKSGFQSYSSSRQAVVTDLTDLQKSINGLASDGDYSVRVLAYNHNGDGSASEMTATLTATDQAIPTLLTARVDSYNSAVHLNYNEGLDESSIPAGTAFTLTINGAIKTPEVAIEGNIVTLSASGIQNPTDVVTVSYTAPSGQAESAIRDLAGNNAASFSAQTVRNDKVSVAITSDPGPDIIYAWNQGDGSADVIEATLTFSEAVAVSGSPELELVIGDKVRRASYHSGSGTTALVFQYSVSEGSEDDDGIEVQRAAVDGLVRYASSKAIAPARVELGPQTGHLVDAVRPNLVSAGMLANQSDLALTFDETMDEVSVPAISDRVFYIWDRSNRRRAQITAVTIQDRLVTLTLSSAVSADDEVLVSIRPASLRHLQDKAGNTAADTTAFPVTIVGQPNSPPQFPATEDGARSVGENTPAGRNIGAPVAATDANSDQLTYSISGTDAALFDVISRTGQLQTREPLDHESRDSYTFTMSVTDGKNTYGSADTSADATFEIDITVDDVDEGPEISGLIAVDSFDENSADNVATYTAADPEGGASTFTWILSGADRGDLTIDSSTGELAFRNVPDYESPVDSNLDNEYLVTIVATDQDNLQGMLDVSVTVSDVNEAPSVTGIATTSFPENSTRSVATYRATDPENDSLTWSTGGADGDDFNISSTGELTFNSSPDFENPVDTDQDNEYQVTVEARDEGSNIGTLEVVVTVTNAAGPEEPTITTTSRPALTYQENGTGTVYTYRARDPQGGSITWSLRGTDAWNFNISNTGALNFASPPDFESPTDANRDNVYEVTVVATDEQGLTDSFDVTVTVTNHAEGVEPVITMRRPPATWRELDTRTVYTFSASDPQQGPITWTLGGEDRLDFTLTRDSGGRGVLAFATAPDYESPADADADNVYEVTVVATDQDSHQDRLAFAITVTDVAEDPSISTRPSSGLTYHSLTYAENRTSAVYTYSASDPQRGAISWSVTGVDTGEFTITKDGTGRGVLAFASQPDYESPTDSNRDRVYEITVVASDEQGLTDELDVRVTVTEVNEGPEISRVGNLFGSPPGSVPENQVQETVLARYTATDPEGSPVSGWRTSGTDSGNFVMNDQGELRFRNVPDYERPTDSNRDNEYVFTVQVSDGRNQGSFEETVTVTPVNEPPAITTTSTSAKALRQAENRTSRLYTYRATDPEGGGTITWSLGGAEGHYFSINERGEFSFREDSPPDYDLPGDSDGDNVYEVTVQVTDDDSNTESLDVTVTVTDVNEGPEVTGGGDSFTVQENQEWAGASFTARDPEQGTMSRWALGGRDVSDFTIDANGVMTFRRTPDFERPDDSDRDNKYEVEVRPFDGRYYGSHQVTVTVEDVNEISGAATIIQPENFEGTLATYVAGGTGDLIVDPGWRLTGTDYWDFTIDEDGQLAFRSIPDHERPADNNRDNEYLFTVQAFGDRYYDTFDVTVTVTPVNEPPAITTTSTSATALSQPENRTTRLYTYRATDPEGGGTVRWSLGGADARFFVISQLGEFSFAPGSPPDYEDRSDADGDNVYRVTVQVSDDSSPPNTESLPVAVTVTEVNEGPEVTSGGSRFTVPENQEWAGETFTASDPEGGTVDRWTLGGKDNGDFLISETGRLTFRSPPDYERPADSDRNNIYEVEVRPFDGRYYGSHQVVVTVTPVNEAPEITTSSTSATVMRHPENRTTRLYTYRAADPENRAVGWSVAGVHARFFSINDRGELYFSETDPPDSESPQGSGSDGQEYQVTVRAADDEGNIANLDVAVTLTDVNEGPEISRVGNLQAVVPENQAQDTVLATYTATDPEDTTAAITRWSVSGRDVGDFVISEQGQLRFRASPDYERPADADRDNVYEVEIRASDGRYTGVLSEAQVIAVTNVNEAPVITTRSSAEFSQRENTASVLYTYRATDADREDVITWSVEGFDGDDFAIHNGVLTFRLLPDYEIPADTGGDNEYQITVVASDGQGLKDTLDATVAITEVNEGPKVTGTTAFTVVEGHDLVGASFTANDQEGDEVTRWSLAGSDGGDFTISESGVLTFQTLPDYDRPADSNRDNQYLVSVRAYDSGNRYGFLDVVVTVTGVNEGAPVVTGNRSLSFRENTAATTRLYTYRATDSDLNTVFSWSVEGADGSDFTITRDSSGRGDLFFANAPDHEQPADRDQDNVYNIIVVASDGGNRGEIAVTVTVTDVNEGPEISGTTQYTVDERQSVTGNVEIADATFTAVDPEGDAVTRWSLAGSDSGDFTITDTSEDTGRNTADLAFRYPPDVDRPADANRDNQYLVNVRAYDNRGRYGSYDAMVTVTGANEPPVITGSSARTFQENGTGAIYTYRATEPEGEDFTWIQPAGPDGGQFEISDRGVLSFKASPDYDDPADLDDDNVYQLTVRAQDAQGNTGIFDVAVTVTDVNEGPIVAAANDITETRVQENHETTSVLLTFSAADPEDPAAAIARWSLSGSDGGDFVITDTRDQTGSNTAALTFRYAPDYDRPADSNRDNEYLVSVRAYDASNRYGSLEVTVTVGSENEAAPVVTGSQSLTFRENTPTTQRLYTYRATDADRNTTITWSVRGQDGSNDGGAFDISETGVLTFSEPPDHEGPTDSDSDNEYLLEIVATDDQGSEGTLEVTVTVTDVNEGPEPTGVTAYTVVEGQSLANATFTARDPDPADANAAVTGWRLAGADAGDFNIGPTGTYTAQLTFRSAPDYDRPADSNRDNEYLVTVRAYNGSTYGELEVKVTVQDENEAEPVVTGGETLSFRENTATDTRLLTYTARDMDLNTTIQWSVRGQNGNTDGGDFTITPDTSGRGELFFASVPNHEQPADADQDNVYHSTVVASDGGNEGILDVTVTITEVNEGPDVTGQASRTVAENFDQVLGTYTAVDPEGSAVTRWGLGGSDAGDFTITDTGQEGGPYTAELSFRNPPDHDRPADSNRDNEYLVTIQPYDGRVYGSYEVIITVTSDNEPPVITGSNSRAFQENGTGSIYTYRATDPEGDDFTWDVGSADASYFQITDRGVLSFSSPPNFENPARFDGTKYDNEYQVTVVADDGNGGRGTFDVTVTVTDQNEGPEIAETAANTAITVQENRDAVLATYTAVDPEDPTLEITRWSVTGRDGGDFTINEDGELSFRNAPDDERRADSNRDNVYEVTVRASDGRYNGELAVVVTVTPVDEAPEFGSNSTVEFTYQENGTSDLYTYRATDPEGGDIAWAVSGTDGSAFEISEKGVLTFSSPPDYESPSDSGANNIYQVTVETRDEGGNTARLEVTVTVTNVTD